MAHARIPILTYHSLDDQRSIISFAPSAFEWQMQWLHGHGYQTTSLAQLARRLRAGARPPDRTVVITFDDGFSTVYSIALPILARYRFVATVFVVPGYCGRSNDWPGQPASVPRHALLTWAQIRELHRAGIEVGAHTLTHPRLDRLEHSAVEREIFDSKAAVEDRLGDAVEVFAYPFGKYNDTTKAIVGRAYVGACTTRLALNDVGSDPLALSRLEALYLTQRPVFAGISSPLFPLYLEARRLLREASARVLQQPWK